MGMLGMLRAESGAMADIMIQKRESFYDALRWVQQLCVTKCSVLPSEAFARSTVEE